MPKSCPKLSYGAQEHRHSTFAQTCVATLESTRAHSPPQTFHLLSRPVNHLLSLPSAASDHHVSLGEKAKTSLTHPWAKTTPD